MSRIKNYRCADGMCGATDCSRCQGGEYRHECPRCGEDTDKDDDDHNTYKGMCVECYIDFLECTIDKIKQINLDKREGKQIRIHDTIINYEYEGAQHD